MCSSTRTDEEHIEDIIQHKQFVLDNCLKLAKWVRNQGDLELSKRLIVEGFTHDIDKFSGIQFMYMRKNAPQSEQLSLAVEEHNKTNLHHPESWKTIQEMEDLYIMVMACDLAARSQQCCTNVREWIDKKALERYNFNKDDEVYKKLNLYLDVILDKPMVQVTEDM